MGTRMFDYQFRLIIIGDMSVGKTAFLKYFTDKSFTNALDPTVGVDFFAGFVQLDGGKRVRLQLWDAAGQERFRCIAKSYYQRAIGALLAYDITKEESFHNLPYWLNEIRENSPVDEPTIIMIGTKVDLEQYREVPIEEAKAFAKFHNINFLETSAKTGENVELCFKIIAEEIYRKIIQGIYELKPDFQGIRLGQPHSIDSLELERTGQRRWCC